LKKWGDTGGHRENQRAEEGKEDEQGVFLLDRSVVEARKCVLGRLRRLKDKKWKVPTKYGLDHWWYTGRIKLGSRVAHNLPWRVKHDRKQPLDLQGKSSTQTTRRIDSYYTEIEE